MWKLQKFNLTKKEIRQINYLVIFLVKLLLSRNFCQKRVRVNFRNLHTQLAYFTKLFQVRVNCSIFHTRYTTISRKIRTVEIKGYKLRLLLSS